VKIALIVGGRSGEHDISLRTGKAITKALGELGFSCWRMVINSEGGTQWQDGSGTFLQGLSALEDAAPDCAFIGMHGPDGEDGKIQAALDLMGIPYQGSAVTSSAICLDKSATKAIYRDAALPVARDVTIGAYDEPDWTDVAERIGFPMVLKTAESGSSVGVEVAESIEALRAIGPTLLQNTANLVVEAWLPGDEFTASILQAEDGSLVALPIVQIVLPTGRFFDYEAKYTPGATDEICPAPISEALSDELKALGLRAHRALGCRHYSRTDFKLDAQGQIHLLETNTLPGLTSESLFPKASEAHGLTFPDLIAHLCRLAVGTTAP
jgi:D-alanine-D-alanine ligase